VLHTLSDEQLETLMARINESDIPNLWRPKSTAFHRIEQIPVLGTGKMDLKSVKQMARELDPEE
jgi:acyl-[acyl-carrier-protein]-phospholipid O-acyltransferase/long-chain-fatty-acid--[acyl-carrier-protein] ligase